MLNLSLRLLSGGVLLLLCLSACIPVPMTTPELYRPLSHFDPADNITDYENHLARFNVAIEADATDIDARFARALLYMGVGKYLPAEDDLTAAIKVADRRPDYSREKAEQDREQGMKLKPSVFKKEYVLRYDGIVL